MIPGLDYIAHIFGYLLWFLFLLFKNYGVAIIFFTIILKVILLPTSIKQQKSSAANMRMAAKQKEIQKKFAGDNKKIQEETGKLYEREGIRPTAGCMTTLIPMLLMLGVYYTVMYPLTMTLHVAQASVDKSVAFLNTLPGIGTTFTGNYGQISLIKMLPEVKEYIVGNFSAVDFDKMQTFSESFKFLGVDLLGSPSEKFWSVLLLVPILCFATSFLSTWYMMRVQQNPVQQGQPGCMKYMMYAMPLFSAYIAFSVPAAVGFYWIVSTIFGFGQSMVLQKFFSASIQNAKAEAQRVAMLEINEAEVISEYNPVNTGPQNFNAKKK